MPSQEDQYFILQTNKHLRGFEDQIFTDEEEREEYRCQQLEERGGYEKSQDDNV